MERYRRLKVADWTGLALDEFADQLAGRDPLEFLLAAPHQVLRRPILRAITTYRVELPPPLGSLIVRDDRTGRPRWSVNPRSIHTLRIHQRLQAIGIDTTQVIAALHRRADAGHIEELVVTRYVSNVELLDPLNNRRPCSHEQMGELLYRVGKLFRRLHDAGFIHGDPIPGNVLISEDNRLLLIDNERTRHLGNLPYFFNRERRDNLMRLIARMLRRRPWNVIRRTLEGYYGITGRPTSRRIRREWLTILRLAQGRSASLRQRAAAAEAAQPHG